MNYRCPQTFFDDVGLIPVIEEYLKRVEKESLYD